MPIHLTALLATIAVIILVASHCADVWIAFRGLNSSTAEGCSQEDRKAGGLDLFWNYSFIVKGLASAVLTLAIIYGGDFLVVVEKSLHPE